MVNNGVFQCLMNAHEHTGCEKLPAECLGGQACARVGDVGKAKSLVAKCTALGCLDAVLDACLFEK